MVLVAEAAVAVKTARWTMTAADGGGIGAMPAVETSVGDRGEHRGPAIRRRTEEAHRRSLFVLFN